MECPICVGERSAASIVTCPSCEHKACKTCYKTYILQSERDTVSCMSCGIIFNRSTIMSLFGKGFLTKTFLDYQKEVRFKRHQAMFPEVLPIVENKLECDRIQQKIAIIEDDIKRVQAPFQERIRLIEIEMKDATHDLYEERNVLLSRYIHHSRPTSTHDEAVEYKRQCLNEHCVGFLNTQFRCGICNTTFCEECYEQIHTGVEHHCDPNLKENVKLMKKDTKNCPTCGTGICKIDGCNQMFCTKCHTAFDWRTGKIDSGLIHNPHYFEYLKENPTVERRHNAAAAGGIDQCFDASSLASTFRRCVYKNNRTGFSDYTDYLIDLIRIPRHFDYEIENLNRQIETSEHNQRDSRVKFLLNEISRKQFDTDTSKDLKKIEFNQEIILLMETVRDVTRDALVRVEDHLRRNFRPKNTEEEHKRVLDGIVQCIKEIENIFSYAKTAFSNLTSCYQSTRKCPFESFKVLEKFNKKLLDKSLSAISF